MSRRLREALGRRAAAEERRVPFRPGARVRVAAVYPNDYRVGMANLGLHALVETLSLAAPALGVYRAFLPPPELLAEHRRSGTPVLTVEEQRPLGSLAALFFSVAFEPDYVGVAQVLTLSGLCPEAERRPPEAPLVVAGGLAPTLNPEPLAPLCDLIAVGEAEALLPPLAELLATGAGRDELLDAAAALPGWYVPSRAPLGPGGVPSERVARQHAPLHRPAYPAVLGTGAAFGGHVDVEVSRGCRWRCRFCAAGHVVTPYRELDVAALAPALDWAVARRGRVGLVGTDVSDHRGLTAIAEHVWARGGELALPSLRVETLARADSPATRLVRARPPRTLTLAVESASESLRCGLNKRLSDDRLRRAARQAAAAGVERLRIYLLAGVPGETWEEVDGMVALAEELCRLGPPGPLTLSVTGLVPKAGTPLQWEPAPDRDYLRRVRAHLRQRLPRGRVELVFESPDWTRWQALLGLGGREVTRHVLAAARDGWRRALAAAAGEPCLAGRAPGAPLPWGFVDHGGLPDDVLRRERDRCRARTYVPPALLEREGREGPAEDAGP